MPPFVAVLFAVLFVACSVWSGLSFDEQLLAARNQDYHFAQTDKDGDYGANSHNKDETHKVTHEVASLSSGGTLSLDSAGDQLYQAAQLDSTGDIRIVSGGHIRFEAVKDLVSESHESSSGDLAWNKMAGNGQVDETLLQTRITTQANLAIDAAQGLSIDVNDINAKTIGDTIDAMVAKDPRLAWLKDAQDRDDVDWRKIKEIHDSWDYESQSMGVATALVVAIVVTVATAGVGGAAGAAAGTAAEAAGTAAGASAATIATTSAMAGAATTAVVASAAVQTTSAVINNQGNLGHAVDALDHSGTYQGLAVAGVTAGLMQGVSLGFSKMGFGSISNDPINNLTHGFELGTVNGTAGFVAYNTVQAGISAGVGSSIYGTSFNDAFKVSLEQAGADTLAALAFNAVGTLSHDLGGGSIEHPKGSIWDEGNMGRIGAHALVGGALTQISDGNFAEGAAAAGLNQLLAKPLDSLAGALGSPASQNGRRSAGAQIAGLVGALAVDGNVNTGANLAKLADAYNRQLHTDEIMAIEDAAKEMQKQESVSEDEAKRRLGELMTALVDQNWREHHPESLRDDKALGYLVQALANNGLGDLYQPFTGSDVPTLPGETNHNSSPDDIRANLLAYADTHSREFNDRTSGGEALLNPYSLQRRFYDQYLKDNPGLGSATVGSLVGKVAGVGDVAGSFIDGLAALIAHPVDSAKAMSYGMQGVLADPWGVVGQVVDNYNNANINAYLDGLQGKYFDASRGATAAN